MKPAAAVSDRSTGRVRGMRAVAAEMGSITSNLHSYCDPSAGIVLQDLAHELAAMIGHEPTAAAIDPKCAIQQLKSAVAAAVAAADSYSGAADRHRFTASFRHVPPLSSSIDRLLGALPSLAPARSNAEVGQVFRAPGTLNHDWHPMGGVPTAFDRVLESTPCAFARQSKIWHAPEVTEIHSAHAAETLRRTLRGFTRACRHERIDGYILTLPAEYGSTLDRLTDTAKQVVTLLSAPMTGGRWTKHPGHSRWHLRYAGHRYFMLTMAPCYPREHSRHAFDADQTFILLQPDAAFDRAVRNQDLGLISPAVRNSIRRHYQDNGQPYDAAISESAVEAHRFVKPIRLGEEPVRWWE